MLRFYIIGMSYSAVVNSKYWNITWTVKQKTYTKRSISGNTGTTTHGDADNVVIKKGKSVWTRGIFLQT